MSLDRDLDLDLELGLCLENRPRGLPERLQSHLKCFLGGPGASWSVPVASRRYPGDVKWTLEAAQKPPSTAQGVPKSASGTPKDAAGAPQAASDWLFLVAEGPLDSSLALLQNSSFYGVKNQVLELPGTPESSLGALDSVAVVRFGASLRRFGVFGS